MTEYAKKLLRLYHEHSSKNKTIEGSPPLTFTGNGKNLKNYRIYGNTVDGASVGDKTENLWDEIYDEDGTLHYVPIAVDDGFFTLSTTTQNGGTSDSSPAANIFFLAGNVSSGASTGGNGVWREHSRTIEAVDGYVTIAYRAVKSYGEKCYPWNNNTMLNLGSTPLPYEPYGYKVPVTIEGKNLFDEESFIDSISSANNGTFNKTEQGFTLTATKTDCYTVSRFTVYLTPNKQYTLSWESNNSNTGLNYIFFYDINDNLISNVIGFNQSENKSVSFTMPENATCCRIRFGVRTAGESITYTRIMLETGELKTVYEPHHAPITTNLYLPEPLKIIGNDAEYVDFEKQKQYFADGTSADVTLPALPTLSGTNTLSVGTAVQPSKVEIKGKIKAV